MSVDHVLAFALVSFALMLVPGPSVLFIVGRALSLGRRSALETVAGNAAGEYAQVLAVAFGIGVPSSSGRWSCSRRPSLGLSLALTARKR